MENLAVVCNQPQNMYWVFIKLMDHAMVYYKIIANIYILLRFWNLWVNLLVLEGSLLLLVFFWGVWGGGGGGGKNPSQETSYKGQRLYEVFKYVIIM